jgi:hypothetical protein
VVRALLRFVVLTGLVIAGWLLGSGVGHANEDLGQPGTGVVRLASDPGDIAGPSAGGSDAQFGLPPAVTSTVKGALSQASISRLPVRPVDVLKTVSVLKPVVRAVGLPRPLTHVLATASHPLSAPAPDNAGVRSQEPAHLLAAVPPAAPAVRAPAMAAPPPTVTAVSTTAGHIPSHAPVCAFAAPAEHPLADELVLAGDPVAPMPTSPPDSATAPCMIGSAAGGGGTKGSPDLAVTENWANAGLASTRGLGHLSARDLPRSPAEQPSASPD